MPNNLRSYNEDKKGGDKGTRGLFCPIDCNLRLIFHLQISPVLDRGVRCFIDTYRLFG